MSSASPHVSIHRAASPEALACQLAEFVAQRLRDGLSRRGEALLVVSGGCTPIPFFEALSSQALDWPRVSVTLADERWLPPDHADSNARLVHAHLLQGPAAQACWVPLYDGATTPQAGRREVEVELNALPWPADVVVLGMGGDGHTASWFPHAAELPELLAEGPGALCMPVSAPALPNVPVPRLTLTRRALLNTWTLVIHTTGSGKWQLLSQALEAGPQDALPVRAVLHRHAVSCHLFHADGGA